MADALWSCFFFLLDVSIRMQVKFQSRSDWISNCCLDIRAASQSCLYKFNYFWYFSYCLLVLIKLFEEVLKLLVKTVQVNFVVKTLLYYYCVYYEIYLNSLYQKVQKFHLIMNYPVAGRRLNTSAACCSQAAVSWTSPEWSFFLFWQNIFK